MNNQSDESVTKIITSQTEHTDVKRKRTACDIYDTIRTDNIFVESVSSLNDESKKRQKICNSTSQINDSSDECIILINSSLHFSLHAKINNYISDLYIEQYDKSMSTKKIYLREIEKEKNGSYKISYEIPLGVDVDIKIDDDTVVCRNSQITKYYGSYTNVISAYELTLKAKNKNIIEKLFVRAEEFGPKNSTIYRYDINYDCWIDYGEIKQRDEKTLILKTGIKDSFFKDVESFIDSEDAYAKFGHSYKRNYLLYGSPGTGKTSCACILACKINRNVYVLAFDPKLTDSAFHSAVNKIKKSKPAILLLEDVDCIFHERNSSTNVSSVSFSALLNMLDGVSIENGLITIITTNHINKLDKALIRPGRVDMMIKFETIVEQQIKDLLELYSIDLTDENVDILLNLSKKHDLVPATFSGFMFRYHVMASKNKQNISEILNDNTYVGLFKKYLKEINNSITNDKYSSMYS
jgi:ATP-dependent 26S proteasome regulatory subunit